MSLREAKFRHHVWPWITFNDVMAVISHYFDFAKLGCSCATVVEVRTHASCDKNVARWIQFSAIYDLWRYSQRLLRKSALKRGALLECENSTCATLRGHLNNSWALFVMQVNRQNNWANCEYEDHSILSDYHAICEVGCFRQVARPTVTDPEWHILVRN